MVLRRQRSLRYWFSTRSNSRRVCKHTYPLKKAGYAQTHMLWAVFADIDGSGGTWCQECIEEFLPFQPDYAKILRGEHFCHLCKMERLPVIMFGKRSLEGKHVFVCTTCFKQGDVQ